MGYVSSNAKFSAKRVDIFVEIVKDEWPAEHCVDYSGKVVKHHSIPGREIIVKVHLVQVVKGAIHSELHEFATGGEAMTFFKTMVPLAQKAFFELIG